MFVWHRRQQMFVIIPSNHRGNHNASLCSFSSKKFLYYIILVFISNISIVLVMMQNIYE